jgi:ammonia channel protein AmtB
MAFMVTGILATKEVNSNLKDDLLATLFRSQFSAIAVTLVLSTCATAVIALILKAVMGLRPSREERALVWISPIMVKRVYPLILFNF